MTILHEVTLHCDRCGTDVQLDELSRLRSAPSAIEVRRVAADLGWDFPNARTALCPSCVSDRADARRARGVQL